MSALTEEGQAELRRFGWTLGPEFEQRYMTDAWVFNLANALEAVAAERDTLRAAILAFLDEAENGDMFINGVPDEVFDRFRRLLAPQSPTNG